MEFEELPAGGCCCKYGLQEITKCIYSNESANAIGIDDSGNIFLAGTTISINQSVPAWGLKQNSAILNLTGKDIFLAKMNSLGELVWIQKAGTDSEEEVKSMVVTAHGIYLCGSTNGTFGLSHRGGKDMFVQKYLHNGENAWDKPFQFGTKNDDECMSIHADYNSDRREVFVSGYTEGDLFGRCNDSSFEKDEVVIKLIEEETKADGLIVVKGRQRSTIGSDSADFIRATAKHLYVISNSYNAAELLDSQANTRLCKYDRHVLNLHDIISVRIDRNNGFFATDVLHNEKQNDTYIAGFAYSSQLETATYGVAKYSANGDGGKLHQVWNTTLGETEPGSLMLPHERVSLAFSERRNELCVVGVADGRYASRFNPYSGLMSSPWKFLQPEDGVLYFTSEMISHFPFGAQEIISVAYDPHNEYLFAGTITNADSTRDSLSAEENILLGRFTRSLNSNMAISKAPLLQDLPRAAQGVESELVIEDGNALQGQVEIAKTGYVIATVSVALLFGGALAYMYFTNPINRKEECEYVSFVNDSPNEYAVIWERTNENTTSAMNDLEEIQLYTPKKNNKNVLK